MTASHLPKITKIYRRCVAPIGRYRIRCLLKKGLPKEFYGPLDFLFKGVLSEEDKNVSDKVEGIREDIARSEGVYKPIAGHKNLVFTPAQTADISSVDPEWGLFLYLCAKSFKANTILELGSSAGISGCFLASAPSCTERKQI